ncbi:uncharacterized protein LOC119318752 [Triticum dicoccoides]|uniref:uncharacterized protein LOC119318752 n=1 Tax=Triticum dicoccoides TaxID=85692 RepID=UPI001890D09D|nr:uncharacterized protein LOC119318752 [Triticum dicoccoides]
MMRSSISSYFPLAAVVIMLLVLTATEAEGIRLDAETRASVSSSGGSNPVLNKPIDDAVKGSTGSASETTGSADTASEGRAVPHGLPEFQEDYYVPSVHSPRHH